MKRNLFLPFSIDILAKNNLLIGASAFKSFSFCLMLHFIFIRSQMFRSSSWRHFTPMNEVILVTKSD